MTAMTVAAAALIGSALVAGAQENYPTKPIRVIVPEVVGSAADLMSRIIGQQISQALGQPVTYENLFLELGVEKGIKAAPDGYTLVYGSSGNVALLRDPGLLRIEDRMDTRGRAYYWVGIERRRAEPPQGSDLWAVRSNFISVTPLCLDYTDQTALEKLATVLGQASSA
jgi:broad specificity polyphosphatase/5'/3'-nucleotidase SurE